MGVLYIAKITFKVEIFGIFVTIFYNSNLFRIEKYSKKSKKTTMNS